LYVLVEKRLTHRRGTRNTSLSGLQSAVSNTLKNKAHNISTIEWNIINIAQEHNCTITHYPVQTLQEQKKCRHANAWSAVWFRKGNKFGGANTDGRRFYFSGANPARTVYAIIQPQQVDEKLYYIHVLYMKNIEKTFIEHLFGEETYNATVMYKRICVRLHFSHRTATPHVSHRHPHLEHRLPATSPGTPASCNITWNTGNKVFLILLLSRF
jgi:hypothetical protein